MIYVLRWFIYDDMKIFLIVIFYIPTHKTHKNKNTVIKQRKNIDNVLNSKFDIRLIHFNTKVNNTKLILLNTNLLCCAWVRERRNK